ncbi:MAG: D-inositol-3-phosphate glycosyltransferase [Candidatus Nanopelagicales bacterium]|nr:D-inositol-3-phosphate glycosyltransferase [Candidatus Nanopelagicales bacterium]
MHPAARPLRRTPRRVAMISVHTSPLDQPGTGDAGGMNVAIAEVSRRLAARGTQVEVFTRATSGDQPAQAELAPGVLVHHVVAGPFEGLPKEDLPGQLCAMTAGVLRREAARREGWYDLVHSHYWLSGQVGWLAKERWGVPLVHTMHTMGRVKNRALAPDDSPEPELRIIGEQQVVDAADRLVANTEAERAELIELYDADPALVDVVLPGVDLEAFHGRDRAQARAALGYRPDERVVCFVGRIQPLKAPDVLVRAAAELRTLDPALAARTRLVFCGGPSGTGTARPTALVDLARSLDVPATFHPALDREALRRQYAAADVVAVPSHSESFGLVAVEAQACGTPVLAADVGGLPVAVADGRSGMLVAGHEPGTWARALARVLGDDALRARLAAGARPHAETLSWDHTVEGLLGSYAAALAAPRDALARVG